MKTITVNTSKVYDVCLGKGLIRQLPSLIAPFCKGRKVGIITDDNVDALYACAVKDDLEKQGYQVSKFVFPYGEESKNINTLSDILEYFASCHFTRKDIFLSIGGGVVGDITGLAAAMYMRGIQFIQVPTTLLSQVDASVGGKTAVDLKAGKNLIGAFWQPVRVVADTQVIADLPQDIFAEGMAEVIKSDLIANAGIVNWTIKGEVNNHLEEIIEACIQMKRSVVEQDEYETKGLRKVLNMGHTVAHAIERLSHYQISHGVAVGTGLVWEAMIAHVLGLCNEQMVQEIKQAVKQYGLLIEVPYTISDMVYAMRSDKKNEDQDIIFMFPITYGNWVEKKLSQVELTDILISIQK